MRISYTYTVVAVDATAKCMEVRYESPGRTPQNIGCRLPYTGETLEGVVDLYAPVRFWQEQELEVVAVAVGTHGEMAPNASTLTLESAKRLKLLELASSRYIDEISGVTVGGLVYDTSRDSQHQIFAINLVLQNKQLEGVMWKTRDNVFIYHDATSFSPVAATVLDHVQTAFRKESELAAYVEAAQSIAAVEQVTWAR